MDAHSYRETRIIWLDVDDLIASLGLVCRQLRLMNRAKNMCLARHERRGGLKFHPSRTSFIVLYVLNRHRLMTFGVALWSVCCGVGGTSLWACRSEKSNSLGDKCQSNYRTVSGMMQATSNTNAFLLQLVQAINNLYRLSFIPQS